MNETVLLSCILAAVTGAFGYFCRRLVAGHDNLRQDFEAEKRRWNAEMAHIRDGYLRQEEFARFQTSIEQKLSQIYDILVSKR